MNTELALNFFPKQYFSLQNKFYLHFSQIATPGPEKIALEILVFESTGRPCFVLVCILSGYWIFKSLFANQKF